MNQTESGSQSENQSILTTNNTENAGNIAMEDQDEKSNNLTKRALFKEKLSDINIANQVCFVIEFDPHSIPDFIFF